MCKVVIAIIKMFIIIVMCTL